jgi:tRNA 2-thiouridine synthesizing protein A
MVERRCRLDHSPTVAARAAYARRARRSSGNLDARRGVCSNGSRMDETEAAWDAGTTGCGELVMELRSRVAHLRPGEVLLLTALDPGAREDVPSWCRMTGHVLERAEHPRYWIRRREG